LEFVERIEPELTRLKIGKELFTVAGPGLVEKLQQKGFEVFLDLKFHDIPNTVAGALSAAASLGVWMVNVHASGGPAMLTAARQAIAPFQNSDGTGTGAGTGTRVIAVTVLTSMDDNELNAIGVNRKCDEQVQALAQLSHESGLDGVVCSPREVALVRKATSVDFLTVTPGVRPASDAVKNDDQRRVMTPAEAIANGSNYLVIGRPITQAENPVSALEGIQAEINSL